jgi:hypothetical protein
MDTGSVELRTLALEHVKVVAIEHVGAQAELTESARHALSLVVIVVLVTVARSNGTSDSTINKIDYE